MNGPPEHRTVQTVIYFLGTALLLLIGGDIWLVHEVVTLDKITPDSVALLVGISGLTGTALGGFCSMLVSTRPGPAAGDPTTFTAPADASVTVEPHDNSPADPKRPVDAYGDPVPVKPSPTEPSSGTRRKRAPRKQAATQRHGQPGGR